MPRVFLLAAAALAALALAPARAAAAPCGLPDAKPVWVDYAEGTVEFRNEVFGRQGVVAATSGRFVPPELRRRGAQTVYWEMRLGAQVGTTLRPRDAGEIDRVAADLFQKAAASSNCGTPWIALNELHGAGTTTPWAQSNAQYRANVLALLRGLAQRGARPFLLLSSEPYTGGDAAEWWRQAAAVADIVPEVYFNAAKIMRLGRVVGPRRVRTAFRRAVGDLTQVGVPVSRIGLMLGFQSGPGLGGREGLEPASRWFDYVELQALAAQQVARELGIATIWSWGWGTLSEAGADEDKPAAACVYLWTRSGDLCDAPAVAGPELDASRSVGPIDLPEGVQCLLGATAMANNAIAEVTEVVGDREVARTILLARTAEAGRAAVPTAEVLAAERTIIFQHFRGSRRFYDDALGRAHASVAVARAAIADELRRGKIAPTLRARTPSGEDVAEFYRTSPALAVRPIEARPAPPWLGGSTQGLALASLAPAQVFGMREGVYNTVRSVEGVFAVKALGGRMPLGSYPLEAVAGAISATLLGHARDGAYDAWSIARQQRLLARTTCVGDQLPEAAAVQLTDYLPFLLLD